MEMFREDKRHEHFEHHHLGRGLHLDRRDNPHRRGILRTWVFIMLQQEPRNGAEIMNQIELISQGNWRPSPGSIYPLLDQLCKEESISKREDGKYEITEKGKKELEWPHRMLTKQPRSADDAIEEMNSLHLLSRRPKTHGPLQNCPQHRQTQECQRPANNNYRSDIISRRHRNNH